MILTKRPLDVNELVIHVTVDTIVSKLCCFALCFTHSVVFIPVLCCTNSLVTVLNQPSYYYRRSCRQLPHGISDYDTCMALPLSKGAARSYHENILSVWQQKITNRVAFLWENCNCLNGQKKGDVYTWTGSGDKIYLGSVQHYMKAWFPAFEGT